MNANISRQRRFWTRRASSWDHHAGHNPGLVRVVERVLTEAAPTPAMRAVDLGCGSGQLALRLAPIVSSVLAVDISDAMIKLLSEHAHAAGIDNVEGMAVPIEHLELEEASVDLIVSNYALHHLRDEDKATVVRHAARWLRPGGRLVIGDMMFGRGSESADRQIISAKLRLLAKRGPGGWWRIAKNATRYVFRFQERPISMERWVALLELAGFEEVEGLRVVAEAAVVRGRRANGSG